MQWQDTPQASLGQAPAAGLALSAYALAWAAAMALSAGNLVPVYALPASQLQRKNSDAGCFCRKADHSAAHHAGPQRGPGSGAELPEQARGRQQADGRVSRSHALQQPSEHT